MTIYLLTFSQYSLLTRSPLMNLIACNLHGLARQANNALDEILLVAGIAEDNDVAAYGS